jgi:opacity protein-like surface antigen
MNAKTGRHMRVSESRILAAAVGGLLAMAAGAAAAADWSLAPRITVNAVWDDNRRLAPLEADEIEVSGAEGVALLDIRAETPRTDFYLTPRVRSTYYPDESDLETTNWFLDTGFEGRGERSRGGFDASYSRQETVGSFFPDADGGGGLGNPDPGEDIGNSPVTNIQERLRIRPTARFDLTERLVLGLDVGYLDVRYDFQEVNERQDYTSTFARADLGFQVSETHTVTLGAEGGRFEPEDGESADTQVVDLEWSNNISETSRVYVRGGANRVEQTDINGVQDWETGFSGGAGVRWDFEVTKLFVDATHTLDPSSSGRVVVRDQVRVRIERRLSEVTTLFLGARGIRDDRPDDAANLQDREYFTASARIAWRFKRDWVLGGGYEFVWREEENDPDAAVSNRLHVGVTYQPQWR